MRKGSLIEAIAKMQNQTPVEFLTDLLARHKKQETMSAELGISKSAIMEAFKRYGITRHKCKDFEYQGVIDSFRGHCRRLGLPIKNTAVDMDRNGLTKPQALDYGRYKKTWDKYRSNHDAS